MVKKLVTLFVAVAVITTFFAVAPLAFAGYKKFSGTYKGKWQSYDFTCPSVYSASSGKSTLKMKVKKKGKFTGTLSFDSGTYKISGKIKKGKITLHFPGYSSKYDYRGTIKSKKVNMIAYNDDMGAKRKCPGGWKQKMRLSK